ncbi:MAG TPA: MOFRL family protein, partial [Fimbriimonadaceae bacterium]|nr:MOFRL family protein [Fimbriimonadaceae bacterium]
VEGVSLSDLQAVNEELLAGGATIQTINAIRARLSRIKGGGLAEAFKQSTNVVVYLSDVEGGLPAVVGSGPFISLSHSSEVEKALAIVQIEERFTSNVVDRIREKAWPRSPANQPHHVMIGNAQMMRDLAGNVAVKLGAKCEFLPPIQGEAKLYPGSITLPPSRSHGKPVCQIAVGEPVVHRTGSGLGGRAQEMACAFATLVEGRRDIAVLVAGSDGTDGPTDAAGALVDGGTVERARSAGFEVEATLAANDSYHFHDAAGSLIKTGPSGTNLNDIVIVAQATSGSD